MAFQDIVKEHLEHYKKSNDELRDLSPGIWNNKGVILEKEHILPKHERSKNYLKPYRKDLNGYVQKNKVKLHQYFHHFNSSQAMCLNFFYPLMKEGRLNLVLQLIGLGDEETCYDKAVFEKESQIENRSRPTSFDFYMETNSGKKIHFEIKYSEYQFGGTKIDDEHIEKFESIYKKYAEKVAVKDSQSCSYFLKNYQLMRNLIHLNDSNSYVVFIYPKRNTKIHTQADNAKNVVKPEFEGRLLRLTWEDVFENVFDAIKDVPRLREQMVEFKKKYMELN